MCVNIVTIAVITLVIMTILWYCVNWHSQKWVSAKVSTPIAHRYEFRSSGDNPLAYIIRSCFRMVDFPASDGPGNDMVW